MVKDSHPAVAATIQLQQGHPIGWSGEFQNQARAMARLAWVVMLSHFGHLRDNDEDHAGRTEP